MSIRNKVFLIILGLFTVLGGIDFIIQRSVIYSSFLELEQNEAEENLRRIFYAIDREITHLDLFCRDWAAWDDSHEFMRDRSETFVASNLDVDTQRNNRLSLVAFCAPDGEVVWSRGLDLASDEPMVFDFMAGGRIFPAHPIFHPEADGGAAGVCFTAAGPLLFSSRPILRTDGSGPSNGFLIMGRLLDQDTVETLRQQTRIPFELVFPFSEGRSACGEKNPAKTHGDNVTFVTERAGDVIRICSAYQDMAGTPIFGVDYQFPREITKKGLASMRYAAILVVVSGAAILVMLNVLLQIVVLRPVQRLTEHAIRIEREGDHGARLNVDRQDEIGRLAQSFDAMVRTIGERTEELKRANERLTQLSLLDGLTGIPNRRMFDSYFKQEWRRAMRERAALSVILIDVDFFKRFNDMHGHQKGDDCLVNVAAVLQQWIRRPADLAARYGGEEFALVLPDTDAEGARLLAEHIRQAVRDLHIKHDGSEVSPWVTISLGVAAMVPRLEQGDQGMGSLLKQADEALYQAKGQGRDRVLCAPDIDATPEDDPWDS
ncbi:MAG: diguanylate cyclase [Deltaproteobacteria bacterium]|nr:diguanylate cyclase [Deltaproteobacteria bacterium]